MLMNIFMVIYTALAFMGFMKVLKGKSTFAKVFTGISLAACVFSLVIMVVLFANGQKIVG